MTKLRRSCQVWGCEEPAVYVNPRSRFVYCQTHYDTLGGHIIYSSKNKDIQPLLRGARVFGRDW